MSIVQQRWKDQYDYSQLKTFKSVRVPYGQVFSPGGGPIEIHPWDIITYVEDRKSLDDEHTSSCTRIARVLALATRYPDGKETRGKVFIVLTLSDDARHAYSRYVSLEDVTGVIHPDSERGGTTFQKWFFSQTPMSDVGTVLDVVHYGAMKSAYLPEYLDTEGRLLHPGDHNRPTKNPLSPSAKTALIVGGVAAVAGTVLFLAFRAKAAPTEVTVTQGHRYRVTLGNMPTGVQLPTAAVMQTRLDSIQKGMYHVISGPDNGSYVVDIIGPTHVEAAQIGSVTVTFTDLGPTPMPQMGA